MTKISIQIKVIFIILNITILYKIFILITKFHDKKLIQLFHHWKLDQNSELSGKISHLLALSSHLAQSINVNVNIFDWHDYLHIKSKAA